MRNLNLPKRRPTKSANHYKKQALLTRAGVGNRTQARILEERRLITLLKTKSDKKEVRACVDNILRDAISAQEQSEIKKAMDLKKNLPKIFEKYQY
jgi:hypothetical protein